MVLRKRITSACFNVNWQKTKGIGIQQKQSMQYKISAYGFMGNVVIEKSNLLLLI